MSVRSVPSANHSWGKSDVGGSQKAAKFAKGAKFAKKEELGRKSDPSNRYFRLVPS